MQPAEANVLVLVRKITKELCENMRSEAITTAVPQEHTGNMILYASCGGPGGQWETVLVRKV